MKRKICPECVDNLLLLFSTHIRELQLIILKELDNEIKDWEREFFKMKIDIAKYVLDFLEKQGCIDEWERAHIEAHIDNVANENLSPYERLREILRARDFVETILEHYLNEMLIGL